MLSKIINKGYSAQQCQICKTKFNLLKLQRIHKCKRCLKYVCLKCGNQKQKVLDEDGKWTTQAHRVCNDCNMQLTRTRALVEKKNIKWAKDSKLSQQWISRMKTANPNKTGKKSKDYQYQHFLKLFHSSSKNFEDDAQIIEKDVIKGRTDYNVFNYSMRQFIYLVQQQDSKQKARINMANVLYAVAARFDQVGYVQGMSSIAAFLLCFCSQQSAYTIFCDLIQNILPQKFLVKGNYGVYLIGMLAQTHFLKQYFVHILTKVKRPLLSHTRAPYTQQQVQHFRLMIQLSTSKALLSLFVNFLSYSHVEFIWNQFSIHRSFQVAQRAFLAAMYLRRQDLLQKRAFRQFQALLESIDIEEFIQAYYDLDIDMAIKSKLIEQFYESLQKKWTNNSQQNIKQLHRYTNFTLDQIKLLQQKFVKPKNQSNISETGVINKEDFVLLIKCYYNILKDNRDNDAPVLEITSHFVQKIFDTFATNKGGRGQSMIVKEKLQSERSKSDIQRISLKPEYLDFREFVCCFSLCTKGLLKDRMCAIINTFEDRNKKISFTNFQKLISNLCEISPPDIQDKKQAFLQRMQRYFSNQQDGISINELSILMNDSFINELTVYIKSDAPGIISKTVDKFLSEKQPKKIET